MVAVGVAYLVIAAAWGWLLYITTAGHAWTHRWQMPLYLGACFVAGLLWLPVAVWHLLDGRR